MRALTLHQPWASLVAAGVKQIETRSWSTSYRGPLAIHAGKKRIHFGGITYLKGTIFDRPQVVDRRTLRLPSGVEVPHPDIDDWPKGAVVATAELVDVVPVNAWRADPRGDGWGYAVLNAGACVWVDENDSLAPRIGEWQSDVSDQLPFGDFTPGRFAWLLDNVRRLDEPVPARGYQGLWTPGEDLVERLAA